MNRIVDDFDEGQMFSGFATQNTGRVPASSGGNPLLAYYRVPGLNVRIPTSGCFLPFGAIELSLNNDLAVLPMCAKDELNLKSPELLYSGAAVESLLRSCVPAIKTPRLISTPDIDVLLLAIRAATYGENMEITATCPKCQTETDFNCHLPSLIATMKTVPPENPVRFSDEVVAYVRPYTLSAATRVALASYEEARKLKSLDPDDDDLRAKEVNKSIDRINTLNLELLAECIVKVVVPGAEVIDPKAIADFIANISKVWVEKVDAKLRELNKLGIDKTLKVTCVNDECKHTWETELEFNPEVFFAGASSR